ncbi:NAD-dependent epimerase/dehydratase family protein [Actinoallomurus rhizosphaericola]|uniref:NAD-dependent epimerase/dehydratase family protein n=1 Tax=Actinoallomurus rhizosphaericola TaxID=2952536 RepID=UPI0020901C66|nr:NAD-dependent epimerase/dehydratase family protein [Actinoallomurus rhizosphaericola]MCO5993179.1 NAD-dependent epimerase/dehydratase family protein [Actinoallomurus rhizosphaericola]
MQIFLTGASGYLGGVLTEHLIAAGHRVSALARSQAARDRVTGLGAEAVPGDLADTAALRLAAERADAVVHAAVDFTDPAMRKLEEPALAAMLAGLRPGSPFVYTSTGLVYPDTRGVPVDEDTSVDSEHSPQPYKVLGERQVLAADGPAVTVIRAALIYGRGGSGLLQGMIAGARERGVATYIGDGANEWSSVHVDDLARLYVAALERGDRQLVVNVATRSRTSMRQIAEAVAGTTGARALSISLEQARQALGPFAGVLTRSSPLDPSRAERVFGWKPVEPGLLDELRTGSYATATRA